MIHDLQTDVHRLNGIGDPLLYRIMLHSLFTQYGRENVRRTQKAAPVRLLRVRSMIRYAHSPTASRSLATALWKAHSLAACFTSIMLSRDAVAEHRMPAGALGSIHS
jgi:hypothetical protein